MLEIIVPQNEMFLEEENRFIPFRGGKLLLEHSLISVRKWEAKHHKSYLNSTKTSEEILSYIECMTLNREVDPTIYLFLTTDMIQKISAYIEDPMTATTFTMNSNAVGAAKSPNEIITAEIIYYWMISLNIPMEYEKWHLNQLTTLIKVVSIKNSPPKKMNPQEAAMRRAELNRQRLAKYNSRG